MSSENNDILVAVFGFCSGIGIFFRGFNRLRRKRLVENTPTSTVRGLAMGLVELQGVVRPFIVLRSPLFGAECAVYKFQVEEYRRQGKSGHWVTIASGNSFQQPFYLEDATGKVRVYPSGAEMVWKPQFKFETGFGKKMPEQLAAFLDRSKISHRGWLNMKSLRFREWVMADASPVYVLGSAQKENEAMIRADQARLAQRLEELKGDPQWIRQEVDTNKDGIIDQQEWESAVGRLETSFLSEAMAGVSLDNAHGVRIAQDQDEKTFIITQGDEDLLIGRFGWICAWSIPGGPFISLVSLGYLIWRIRQLMGLSS